MSSHRSAPAVALPLATRIRAARRDRTFPVLAGAIAATALVAVLVTHLVDFGADNLRVGLFNANTDASWSHLLTAAVLVAASGLGLVAFRRTAEERTTWLLTTVVLAFLAIDEISPLHTKVDAMSWGKLVYAPVLIVLCVCLWRLSQRRTDGVLVRAGVLTLIVSFAIHVLGPHIVHALGWSSAGWAYQTKVALKAGSEVAGWLLVLFGLRQLAR
jgi:hypothetical protein